MMEFRCANQHPQRTERQPDIGMDVDSPNAAEGQEASQRFKRETQQERGQIDQAHRISGVERMFAMGSEPIEMFGAVMDGMKAPKEFETMLQAMSPIDEEVTQ